ncbi:hypothetical protein BYT27DRAFT_7105019, partial [Phlegmacium glaucopus]
MLHESDLPKFLWGEAAAHAVYLKNRTWTRTLGDTTPYEILNKRKPNLSNVQIWGCKVRVHDTSGSKLDGRSKIGRWMGFDEETRDGHRVYWPERRIVTVERSVKFNFDDESVVIGELPLDGGVREMIEPSTSQSIPTDETPNLKAPEEAPDVTENVTDIEPALMPVERRGQRIRKESEYVRRLREGTGVTGERSRPGLLPKGVQRGSELITNLEEGKVGDAAIEDYAMATVIGSAEGIEPTYDEARKRPDWPK